MMSAELMQWTWEATLWASIAIVLVMPMRWLLGRLFGVRVSILAWMLVPLVCAATMLPPRTVEYSVPVEAGIATPVSSTPTDSVTTPTTTRIKPRSGTSVVATAWTTGALAWLLVFSMRQRALGKRIGIRRCSGRICVSGASKIGPMVVGVFSPRVVLPADFRSRFSRSQQRLVLAHELTHIRRRDPLWNVAAATFQCLMWFNPLVHWAASRFRRDQELACDAAVLESRSGAKREYADALLQLNHSPSFGLPAFGGHPLTERITMLTRISGHSPNRHRIGVPVAALLALGIGFAAWAADTEIRETREHAMFSFDIDVTVDGVREAGTLTVTGDEMIAPIAGGKPRPLARERLLLEHESARFGWSAQVEVTRAGDETFWVAVTILKNNKVVAASKNIMTSGAPLIIEQTDPDIGGSTYRINITPVVPDQGEAADVSSGNSAVLMLRIDDAGSVARPVRWPVEPGDAARIGMSKVDVPESWNASIEMRRQEDNRIELCFDRFEQSEMTFAIMEDGACIEFDANISDSAYMAGGFDDAEISWRLDLVPLSR